MLQYRISTLDNNNLLRLFDFLKTRRNVRIQIISIVVSDLMA
jgi:hypothetical protein